MKHPSRRSFRLAVETLEGRALQASGGLAATVAASAEVSVRAVGHFVRLFNGRNLTGFQLDGRALTGRVRSPDGVFVARNGVLVVNPGQVPIPGRPTLRTVRSLLTNVTLHLEFRAAPDAEVGLVIGNNALLAREGQASVGPLAGYPGFRAGGWNRLLVRLRIDAAGIGQVTTTLNGQPLLYTFFVGGGRGSFRTPLLPLVQGLGPLGFQAGSGKVEYRRIFLRRDL